MFVVIFVAPTNLASAEQKVLGVFAASTMVQFVVAANKNNADHNAVAFFVPIIGIILWPAGFVLYSLSSSTLSKSCNWKASSLELCNTFAMLCAGFVAVAAAVTSAFGTTTTNRCLTHTHAHMHKH